MPDGGVRRGIGEDVSLVVKIGQIGTRHGHAAGKARSMVTNPDVELIGVYEPDPERRSAARRQDQWRDVPFLDEPDPILANPDVAAVAIEGSNAESLAMAREALARGKHLWYDKPGGDDLAGYRELIAGARRQGLLVQMGYMFRYHHGFRQVAEWVRSGLLGEIFSVRAHMSTWIPITSETTPQLSRQGISVHPGGIFYDLAGHMLDQIVGLLGRPDQVQGFFQNAQTPEVPAFMDNTLGIFRFDRALAVVDIAAMEARPMARRFEVYGSRGSAILLEPFEPARAIRLCLDAAVGAYPAGDQVVPVQPQTRQDLYDRELDAFVATLSGRQTPDRSLDHELLVQETLLRTTRGGGIPS